MTALDDFSGDLVEVAVSGPRQAITAVELLAARRHLTPAQMLMRAELSRDTRRQWAHRGVDGLRLVSLVALMAGLEGDMAVCPTGSQEAMWWPAAQVHPAWDAPGRQGESALALLVPPLQAAAAAAGLNQPALARDAGLSYMTVVRLFHSAVHPQERPRLSTYLAVSGSLGLELRIRSAAGLPLRGAAGPSV